MKIVRSGLSMIDRQNNNSVYDTGLEAQNIMKISAFYAQKLSGK
jgi:hypothetical protein